MPIVLSKKAIDLILRFEGVNQPSKWPGYKSGITIGYGYDLGYVTIDRFESDWNPYLDTETMDLLCTAVGKIKSDAQAIASRFKKIVIRKEDSYEVFMRRTVPDVVMKTERAFPGVLELPIDAQGALVSLVMNRGESMKGDTRAEMRAIREAVQRQDLREIALQLRQMKRLWEGKGVDGLLTRREQEACLVESTIKD